MVGCLHPEVHVDVRKADQEGMSLAIARHTRQLRLIRGKHRPNDGCTFRYAILKWILASR